MFNGGMYKSAYWIKPDVTLKDDKQRHSWFKNNFHYDGKECNIRICAHSKYKIFINKKRYASGPCSGNRWNAYWDEFNITDVLQSGINEVLVQVVSYEPESFDKNTNAGPMSTVSYYISPCLIISSTHNELTTGSGNWLTYKDESIKWINQKLPAFTCVGPVEECDFGKSPLFNTQDKLWITPVRIGIADAFGFGEHSPFMLKTRPIPYLRERYIEFTRHMPIRKHDLDTFEFNNSKAIIKAGETKVCELDIGEMTNAYLQLKANGCGTIKVTYAECYTNVGEHYYEKGIRDDWETKSINGFSDVVNINGECEYEPFDWRSFRFVRLEVESTEKDICIFMPKILTSEYPLDINAEFRTNEPWCDTLWDISIRTLELCMNDKYMDCPYYERMQYSLDTRLEALYTYRLSGDAKLAKKAIKDFQQTLTPEGMLTSRAPTNRYNVIPNFALHWIMMLEEYYMETGDIEFVKENLPTMMAIISWFEKKINSSGMIESYGYWNFIDWCGEWEDYRGILTGVPENVKKTGISATNTLMFATALQSAVNIFDSLNRKDTAKEYANLKKHVNSSVVKLCMNNDNLITELPNDKSVITQHAQVWSVLSGAVDSELGKTMLIKSMDRDSGQCTFVMRYFLLRALEKVGMYSESLEAILEPWKEAPKLNLTTWPEDFAKQRSDCHAWSSLPIYEFASGVLGVNPEKPGWKSIVIKPHIVDFEFAEGTVPTPNGDVNVRWEKKENKILIKCSVPDNISAKLILPNGECVKFMENCSTEMYFK